MGKSAIIRWPPRRVTALQVVRTSFLGPRPRLNVSLNYISCPDCLSRSLSYRFSSCCFQSSINIHAGVLKMPRVSNEYCILEVKCKRKWFWDLFLITSAHSNTRHLALQVWHLAKFRSGWSKLMILEIELKYGFFESFGSRPIQLPCIMADWPDWTVPSNNEFFIPNVLCCCYFYNLLWKESECFDCPEYWMGGICLVTRKCRIYYSKIGQKKKNGINSVRGLNDKQTSPDSSVYLYPANRVSFDLPR